MTDQQRYLAALAAVGELENSKVYNSRAGFAKLLSELERMLDEVAEPVEPFGAFLEAQFKSVVALSESDKLFGGIQQP